MEVLRYCLRCRHLSARVVRRPPPKRLQYADPLILISCRKRLVEERGQFFSLGNSATNLLAPYLFQLFYFYGLFSSSSSILFVCFLLTRGDITEILSKLSHVRKQKVPDGSSLFLWLQGFP